MKQGIIQTYEVNYILTIQDNQTFGRVVIEVHSNEPTVANEQIKQRVKRYLNFDKIEIQEPRLIETKLKLEL